MYIVLIIIVIGSIFYFKKSKSKKLISSDNPIRKIVHSVLEKEFKKEPVTVGGLPWFRVLCMLLWKK